MTRSTLMFTTLAVFAATGCDSLVAGQCEDGMVEIDGHCRLATGDEPDAGGPDPTGVDARDPDPTGGPDAAVCTADTMTDPMNCGACGNICAPGMTCRRGNCRP